MMKPLSLLSNLVFSYILFCSGSSYSAQKTTYKSQFHLKAYVEELNQSNVMGYLRGIVNAGRPNRLVGTVGHRNTVKYILSVLNKLDKDARIVVDEFVPDINKGKKLYQKDFDKNVEGKIAKSSAQYILMKNFTLKMQETLIKYKDVKGKNIIWEKEGKLNSDKVLILTAHYDTIASDKKSMEMKLTGEMPGADYNASGVAVLLSIINRLSNADLKHSVKVVFLDYQALGYLGSEAYARNLKINLKESKQDVLGVINFEMLGHDSKTKDKRKKLNNMCIYSNRKNHKNYKLDLKLVNLLRSNRYSSKFNINFEHRANGFNNSDNFRFSDAGFGAITLSQNWEEDLNEKRMTVNDFPETINQQTLYNSYRYSAFGVLSYLLRL